MGGDMRILLATPRFAPQVGGAETWTHEVSAHLAARGHIVEVIARAFDAGAAPGGAVDLPVRRVTGSRLAFSGAVIRQVASVRPHVVMAQFSAIAPSVIAARRIEIPVVGVVHDVYGFAESVRIKGLLVGVARHLGLEQSLRLLSPQAFVVPSRSTARRLRPFAHGRPVTVVPAGADHVPHGTRGIDTDRDQVVFVGRLVPYKGAAHVVEALRILHARGRRIGAVIVGTGPEEARIRQMAGTLPIRFAGVLEWEQLDRLVRGSAVVVIPSTREGWGLAVTEAAARGVPYVAYDIPAVREQHDELGGGILVPPRVDALAEALGGLLDDPAMGRALGERGRQAAAGRSWAAAAEVVERALEAAVSGAR